MAQTQAERVMPDRADHSLPILDSQMERPIAAGVEEPGGSELDARRDASGHERPGGAHRDGPDQSDHHDQSSPPRARRSNHEYRRGRQPEDYSDQRRSAVRGDDPDDRAARREEPKHSQTREEKRGRRGQDRQGAEEAPQSEGAREGSDRSENAAVLGAFERKAQGVRSLDVRGPHDHAQNGVAGHRGADDQHQPQVLLRVAAGPEGHDSRGNRRQHVELGQAEAVEASGEVAPLHDLEQRDREPAGEERDDCALHRRRVAPNPPQGSSAVADQEHGDRRREGAVERQRHEGLRRER